MKKITILVESEEEDDRIEAYFERFLLDNFQTKATIKIEDEPTEK